MANFIHLFNDSNDKIVNVQNELVVIYFTFNSIRNNNNHIVNFSHFQNDINGL